MTIKHTSICIIYSLLFVMLVNLTGCQQSSNSQPAQPGDYETIYRNLSLVHSALDFPGSTTAMRNCRQQQTGNCIRIVNNVTQARDQLLKLPHDEVLSNVLDTIASRCMTGQSFETLRDVCGGAVTALFFFNSEQDDEAILKTFRTLPDDVVKNVFSSLRGWYYNRSNPDAWVTFIQSSRLDPDHKTNFTAYFKSETEPFGLMLL